MPAHSSWSLISRPPWGSASPSAQACLPWRTRSSNERRRGAGAPPVGSKCDRYIELTPKLDYQPLGRSPRPNQSPAARGGARPLSGTRVNTAPAWPAVSAMEPSPPGLEHRKMQRTKLGMLKEAWSIARPYWFSDERWLARGLLAAVLAMNLAQVWINVRLNSWRNDFYNSLQNYDEGAFFYQLALFAVLAGAYILLLVYGLYLQQMLQIRWRRWMTNVYLKEWLGDNIYYRLQLTGDATDNPDQRIAEDLNLFPAQTLNLSLGLLTNIVQAVSFSFILWDLSGALDIPLGGWGTLSIPGYMFWAVVVYTAVATWVTVKLGRPLVSLNFAQQRLEADFRFSLVRLREYSESVAFYGGEPREFDIFSERFGKVFANFWAIMVRTRILGFAQYGSSQAAVVFPYLVAD